MARKAATPVTYFVSYASRNRNLATDLLDKLSDQLGASRSYAYRPWRDEAILAGERWHDEIREAIATSTIGLGMISPAFLASEYIGEHELPAFVGDEAKPVVPIMLQPVDFDRHDLKGLEALQIFRYQRPRFKEPKAYADCSSQHRRNFTEELFRTIELRLDKIKHRTRSLEQEIDLLEGNELYQSARELGVDGADLVAALKAAPSPSGFIQSLEEVKEGSGKKLERSLGRSVTAQWSFNQARSVLGATKLDFEPVV